MAVVCLGYIIRGGNGMNEQEWLGSDNQLGLDIWKNKYCNDGETFDHWLERISGGDREVADLIKKKKVSLWRSYLSEPWSGM